MGPRVGWCPLGFTPTAPKDLIPVPDYVQGNFVPISRLMHEWEFHSALALSPAEERTMVREPAQAVPAAIAQRLGKLRVLAVAYIACLESGDVVSRQKPKGEAHTAAVASTVASSAGNGNGNGTSWPPEPGGRTMGHQKRRPCARPAWGSDRRKC